MNHLTNLESLALEHLQHLNYFFDCMKVPYQKRCLYRDIRGELAQMIRRLEAKQYGCLQGVHLSYCSCTEDKRGYANGSKIK